MQPPPTILHEHLQAFDALPCLKARVSLVLASLPREVLDDFCADRTFQIRLEDYTPGQGSKMFMTMPEGKHGVSRCVVLREKLDRAPEDFALYIIAHEFAHAYLRNGGWEHIADPEDAADALAEHWGYPKSARRWF